MTIPTVSTYSDPTPGVVNGASVVIHGVDPATESFPAPAPKVVHATDDSDTPGEQDIGMTSGTVFTEIAAPTPPTQNPTVMDTAYPLGQ